MKRTFTRCLFFLLLVLINNLWGQSLPPVTPTITSFTPASYPAGADGFVLKITGTNFQSTASVRFTTPPGADSFTQSLIPDGDTRTSTNLDVFIFSGLIDRFGTAQIVVRNGDPSGDGPFLDSASRPFQLTLPTITSLSP